jgi:hypothetical protein
MPPAMPSASPVKAGRMPSRRTRPRGCLLAREAIEVDGVSIAEPKVDERERKGVQETRGLRAREQKKEGTWERSLSRAEQHRGSAVGLAGDVCSNNHEFRFLMVLGKLGLCLAHRKFAARRIAFRPNLIEEVVVAQALEQ